MVANPNEIEAVVEHQEVANKEAAVETIVILKDQSGDQQLAVGCHNPCKRQTKDSGVQGALQGWTFRKRRWTWLKFNSSIRDRGQK
jgi:hypothetical protein